jgi:hypothetical protein
MLPKHDSFLTKIAVCIQHPDNNQTIGSGVVYNHKTLGDKLYILSAAHCFFNDGDQFQEPVDTVNLLFFNVITNNYETVVHRVDFDLVSADIDKDVAVLVISRQVLESLTGTLPMIEAVQERHSITHFIGKGFPSATMGRELVAIEPKWMQEIPTINKFQLHLSQDFSSAESARSQVDGFSGSGLFLVGSDSVYLYGIFTRFLEAGKLIYGQYLATINELLKANFLPTITFTFFGSNGLTPDFFKTTAVKSVDNLGPRFNEALNLRLPIALKFNDLAKDGVFKQRFLKAIDQYLTANNYRSREHQGLETLEDLYDDLKKYVNDWYSAVDWSPEGIIDRTRLYELIEEFNAASNEVSDTLYAKRSEIMRLDKGENKNYSYNPPLSGELSRVREMQRNNRELVNDLEELEIDLSNSPVMFLKGEAGSGKSHLFGDVVSLCNENGQPALLLLGQLFKKEQTIWQNILSQLDLPCTKDEFLSSLDAIGRQTGSRVLLMIDAINEGAGKDLWFDALPGFIHDFKAHRYVGLALSIRSTYWNTVVPKNVQSDQAITKLTHEGFSGNEYKALQLFCAYYGIRQPNFPILAPEYTSPLFLQLICQGIKASGKNVFPAGFQGISKIFIFYTSAVAARLAARRDIYKMRQAVIKSALEAFASAAFEKDGGRSLTVDEALALFDEHYIKYPDLLSDLIEEGVFIKGIRTSYDENVDDWEIIYFAYERFGDFYMAGQLLAPFQTQTEVKNAFAKGEKLGEMAGDMYRYNTGILEAFAVLLPEKFQLEIVEVFHWLFEDESDDIDNTKDWLNQWMINSLKWRDTSSIDNEKLTQWIRSSGHFFMDINNYLYFLVEMCAVGNHPFNGDRLHRFLSNYTMAERDGFWQRHIQGYHGRDDSEMAFPITRLIDWAWQDDISVLTDRETARLAGQTLAWILCTTNRGLRDQTTKAMVNLLQDQPGALIAILDAFKDTDDMYIAERLYAVGYGCTLRSSDNKTLEALAKAIYQRIFENRNPPEHILLRDYARCSIEYAFSKGLVIDIDMNTVRPPYQSILPDSFPTEEQVKKHELDDNDPDYRKKNGSATHQILRSVLTWDFSRYTIDSALHHLSPLKFTFKDELDVWLNKLPRGSKADLTRLEKYLEMRDTFKNRGTRMDRIWTKEDADKFRETIEKFYKEIDERVRSRMNPEQLTFFDEQVMPYFLLKLQLKKKENVGLDHKGIKQWIVQRVFDLGYNGEIHGDYDSSQREYDDRSSSRVERIGKKYQWIAFHQMMAILTDNYKIQERWSDRKAQHYQGPWEMMLRDVDPSFTTREERDKYPEDDFGVVDHKGKWWSMGKYDYWHRIPADWANTIADMPNPAQCIQKTDEQGKEWLYLNMSYNWKEPKLVGRDRWDEGRKEIWYMFQAYFIPKAKAPAIKDWLRQQNFFGRWLPENHSLTDLLARENYWSPISKEQQRETSLWQTLRDSNHKVMLATATAIGEMSEDKSGAHFQYLMPARKLFDALGLHYARKDGEFLNPAGEIVVTNVSPNGAMIRKDELQSFLETQNMEVIWLLLGEKNSFNRNNEDDDFRKAMSGVYSLAEEEISGSMNVTDW